MTQDTKDLERFSYFSSKEINDQFNDIAAKDLGIHLFDLSYSEGVFIAKEDIKATFLLVEHNHNVPHFILEREHFLGGINEQTSFQDLNFSQAPDFSRRFFLGGKDPEAIQQFFDPKLIFFFESHGYYRIESIGKSLLIKGQNRLSSIQEIKRLLAFTHELMAILDQREA